MPKTNEQLKARDLIRPLSVEAILYFTSGAIPTAHELDDPLKGKFIRLGDVMIFGTTLKYGERQGALGFRRAVDHQALHHYLKDDPALYERGQSTSKGEVLIAGALHDAGSTEIKTDADGNPQQLIISDVSGVFGAADHAGRQKTVEVAQELTGESVTVLSGGFF